MHIEPRVTDRAVDMSDLRGIEIAIRRAERDLGRRALRGSVRDVLHDPGAWIWRKRGRPVPRQLRHGHAGDRRFGLDLKVAAEPLGLARDLAGERYLRTRIFCRAQLDRGAVQLHAALYGAHPADRAQAADRQRLGEEVGRGERTGAAADVEIERAHDAVHPNRG